MFDRYEGGQRALLVSLQFPDSSRDPNDALAELTELTESAGASVLDCVGGASCRSSSRSCATSPHGWCEAGLGHRIKRLSQTLERVRARRERGRASRRKADIATVSLVGYTNAGKSTLFNALTDAEVYAADRLFATLDPTLRRLELPGGQEAVIADTVGFISDLPHELVEAFHATLQESAEAALLLHVIDCADPARHELVRAVHEVLESVGAERVPCLEVYTKVDLREESARIERHADGRPERVWVSAISGDGLGLLREAVAELIGGERVRGALTLAPSDGKLRATLYHLGAVREERPLENGALELDLDMDAVDWQRLMKREGLSEARLRV